MVTLDNKLVGVGEFKGDIIRGRKDFQRSVQGSQREITGGAECVKRMNCPET